MNPLIAILVFAVAIGVLFVLNRDSTAMTSRGLWAPVAWLLIAGTRNVSEWLGLSAPGDVADRYLEGSPVDRYVLTAIMLCGLIVLVGRKRRVGALLKANPAILAYFFYCAISLLWSDYPLVGGKRWFRSLGDVIMILVILTDRSVVMALKRVLNRVGFLLLPISILLIRYFPDKGRSYGVDGVQYWTGVTTGKNSLGMICLIFGLASLWQFLFSYRNREDKGRTQRLVAHATMVSMALWLLWVADSKTSLSCFALIGGLMTVTSFSPFARRPGVLLLMIVGLVSVSFTVLFLGVGGGALQAIGRDQSLTGRTDVWKLVVGFVENPWVGAGYESFWMGRRLTEIRSIIRGLNQAHNGYIEVYLNLGWVGVILLGGIIVSGCRRIIRGFRWDQELSTITMAYFVVAVIYNFTEGMFKMMTPVWIAFLLATMAVPRLRSRKARTVAPQPPESYLRADLSQPDTRIVSWHQAPHTLQGLWSRCTAVFVAPRPWAYTGTSYSAQRNLSGGRA
jgi:exopolysaccharide production protein ExoQ